MERGIDMNKVFEALKVIREHCKKTEYCEDCPIDDKWKCGLEESAPINWDIEDFVSRYQGMEGET